MVRIYDRAVVIEDDNSFQRLVANPKQFLEEIGAFDGIKEFNGIQDEDGMDIHSMQDHFSKGREGNRYYLMHKGIPWSLEELCKWQIMK